MSGYGGNPPPGWQDPYGGPQDPYGGAQGWEQAPYPGAGPQPGYGYDYGYGPPGGPVHRGGNGSAIACLVCNSLAVVMCCSILSIPGIIVAALAMGRVDTDPESARKLTLAGWILFGASIFLGIILAIVYFVVLAAETTY